MLEDSERSCDNLPLEQVRTLPFGVEPVDDEIYYRVLAAGREAIPCLIERVSSTDLMQDPRPAPSHQGFVVGDLAHLLLTDLTEIEFDAFLPGSVKARFPEIGVYAYFAYVDDWRSSGEFEGLSYA